ncbi:hypothetical protein Lalb_Chr16g0388181 [Lupinus albus]|uniref:Uncharacterized protein n=1 Tax=Lupinus albus TaxID=3870 RepID=A0A6A4P4H3_LUPAL|nr:hypothetical protein Lalb_Chr16g0388181 [Lupinus albus]
MEQRIQYYFLRICGVHEVGWLLDDGHAITSTCLFSSTANLEELSIALETRAPEDV